MIAAKGVTRIETPHARGPSGRFYTTGAGGRLQSVCGLWVTLCVFPVALAARGRVRTHPPPITADGPSRPACRPRIRLSAGPAPGLFGSMSSATSPAASALASAPSACRCRGASIRPDRAAAGRALLRWRQAWQRTAPVPAPPCCGTGRPRSPSSAPIMTAVADHERHRTHFP